MILLSPIMLTRLTLRGCKNISNTTPLKGYTFITNSALLVIHHSLVALSKIPGFQCKVPTLFPGDMLVNLNHVANIWV